MRSGRRARTSSLLNQNQAFCQLNYSRIRHPEVSERHARLELAYPAWKAGALPVKLMPQEWHHPVSIRGPLAFQASALPTELQCHANQGSWLVFFNRTMLVVEVNFCSDVVSHTGSPCFSQAFNLSWWYQRPPAQTWAHTIHFQSTMTEEDLVTSCGAAVLSLFHS